MQWFGNSWEDKEVVFPARDDQPATTWKLGTKLAGEKFNLRPKRLTDKSGPSGAWVPFECKQDLHAVRILLILKRLFFTDKWSMLIRLAKESHMKVPCLIHQSRGECSAVKTFQ